MNEPAESIQPGLNTICARHAAEPISRTQPLAPALQTSVVYKIEGLEQIEELYRPNAMGFIYARDGHPNAAQLAEKIARIEGAESAAICSSGMAAEAVVFLAMAGQGDHIALAHGVYGKTHVLVARELTRMGIAWDGFDPTDLDSARAAIRPNTKIIFVETLSNPLLRLARIEGLAEIARASGAYLVVDHTFAPLLCRPLEMGADLVTHSATKMIGGHSDVTLGAVAGSSALVDRVGKAISTFGAKGAPFECWLTLRGVATLGLRSERSASTALELAKRLADHPAISAVHYPGLPSHPDHDEAARVFRNRFGSMITIDLGGRDQADALIRKLRHVPFAPSLGDVSTTLSHPSSTSHRDQSPEQWRLQGITPGLVRLSIGLEDIDDLWMDFRQALDG